jgi:HEAT repeat protein
MTRLAVFALAAALACQPAAALDWEKWLDDITNKEMEGWKKDNIKTLLKHRDADKRLEALERLSYTDPDAVAAFAAALGSDKDARVRQAAASKLWSAEKRAEPYREDLVKALDDPDPNVVAYAAGALQAIGMKEEELAPARKRVLDAPEASVSARFLVSRNLVGYEAPTKLVGPMLDYLEQNSATYTGSVTDSNRKNVELAQQALERLVKNTKDRELIAPMWRALVETRNGQIPLMKALGLFEPRPEGWTSSLVRQLDNANPRVRSEALNQMRTVRGEKEVAQWLPHAARMLDDPDRSVRSYALWAIGSAKGLAASQVDRVALVAGDPDNGLRRDAVRALGEIAEANQPIPAATRAKVDAVARPVIERAQNDDDKDVRDEARTALRNIGGSSPALAAAASPAATPAKSSGNEAAALQYLRTRKIKLDEQSFFVALQQLDVALVHAFLDAGMSPNANLSELGPPLRVMLFASPQACSPSVRPTRSETKQIAALLLERGADIQGSDANGNTAITEAASKGCDRELMRMLIKAGAKMNVPNKSGLTPFEMGLWMGHDGLEELIAAGYRLPPDKVKGYLEGYKDRPAAIAMVKKAAAPQKK